jgi:hypothetical protein
MENDLTTGQQYHAFRGRVHVNESVYESPYDWLHNLLPKGLGFLFSIIHPLQPFVNTFQKKSIPNSIAIHPWHQIVHRIEHRFVREFVRVDGPLKLSFLRSKHLGARALGMCFQHLHTTHTHKAIQEPLKPRT